MGDDQLTTYAFACIRTRYAGPTNTKGSRVLVSEDRGFADYKPRRMSVSWDHALNVSANHAAAAQAWLDRHNAGARVVLPGLEYDNDFYFTWEMA